MWMNPMTKPSFAFQLLALGTENGVNVSIEYDNIVPFLNKIMGCFYGKKFMLMSL